MCSGEGENVTEANSAAAPANEGPLKGLRVIEMGTLIAGPFCGQILGDFGADVIKIEDPKVGDPMRQWGRSLPKGLSPWWPVIGRNKKSVSLNLRTPEGRAIAETLIDGADVLIENFRPGTMEKWGMGYDALAARNPRLIMARVSGFGQTGPYAARAGYGLIGGNGDTVYARLCETMGRPELAADPRFLDHAARGANQAELDQIIAAWTRTQSLDALLELLESKGIPAGRIFRAPDMLEHEQFKARESIVETDHPVFGKIKMQNAFPKMSETPGAVRWAGPELGQHTDEVLAGAGLTAQAVAELRAKGVV
jgi:crotonobetainyl-CoA:carnitine CoA-transferase CaiB-like acyl-CoA transferase